MNQFRPVTMIARTAPGTHNTRISAQTVTNPLREIGEKTHIQCMFYMRRFLLKESSNAYSKQCTTKS